jgi:hypothetical protein
VRYKEWELELNKKLSELRCGGTKLKEKKTKKNDRRREIKITGTKIW